LKKIIRFGYSGKGSKLIAHSSKPKTWGDDNPDNFVDLSIYNPGNSNEAPGIYHFAAHIQSLADPAGGSAWVGDGVPVPEPGTLMLLGAGLLGLWVVRRRK